MATKPDTTTLSQPQEMAIAALIRGATVTDAATEAGVSRQTVSGWRNHDPQFIAALNRGRHDVWDQVEDRLRALHVKALEVIEQELEGPDKGDVALTVMKVLARVNIVPTGATSARDIAITQREIANAQRLQELITV